MRRLLVKCLAAAALQATAADWIDAFLAGSRSLEQGDAAKARTSFEQALTLLPGHGATTYQLACALARSGSQDEALTALERAIQQGYEDVALTRWDPDLASLRETARFKQILARLPVSGATVPPPFRLAWNGGGVMLSASANAEFVAAGRGGSSALWDVRTCRMLATLTRADEGDMAVQCSPDGRFVVVTGENESGTRFVHILDAASGDLVRELPEAAASVDSVTFSEDLERMLLGPPTQDEKASIWSTRDWSHVGDVPEGYDQAVLAPNGKRLLLVVRRQPNRSDLGFWDIDQAKLLVRHDDVLAMPNLPVEFTRDGKLVAVHDHEGRKVLVFDALTGARLADLPSPGSPVCAVTFTGTPDQLATLDHEGRVAIWDFRQSKKLRSFLLQGLNGTMHNMSASAGLLLVREFGGPTLLIDLAKDVPLWTHGEVGDHGTSTACFTPGGHFVLISSFERGPVLRDARSGVIQTDFGGPGVDAITCVDPRGECYWACAGHSLRAVDFTSGRTRRLLDLGAGEVRALAIGPDSSSVAIVDSEGLVKEFDLISGHERWTAMPAKVGQPGWGSPSLQYAPDGKHVAVSTSRSSLDVYSTASGRIRQHLARGTSWAWSADGRWIAAGATDGSVDVLDLAQDPPTTTRFQVEGSPEAMAFEPRGTRLWIGSDRSRVDVFELEGGARALSLDHKDLDGFGPVRIGSITFRADGELASVATSDIGHVAAWRTSDGKRLWSFGYRGGTPASLFSDFMGDGKRLCVWGQTDHSPRIVDSATGKIVVDLADRGLGTLMPLKGNRALLATSARGVDALDPATGELRWSRVEFEGGGALLHTPSGFVDAPRAVLEGTQVALSDRSYPLDGLAAAMLDPKKVAASAEGVHVAPVRIGERPSLSWSKPLPRVVQLAKDEREVEIVAEGQSNGGLLAFEVVRDGVRERRPALAVEGDPSKGRLVIKVARPAAGTAVELYVRSIAKNGLASRPLLVAVEASP